MSTVTRISSGVESSRKAARASAKRVVSLSRQGVIAAERFGARPKTRTSIYQLLSLFSGSAIIGLGVSLFVHSRLGVPAFDVMLTALRDQLGITLGQAGWLFTGSLFVVATLLRQPPRLNGIFYVFTNGASVDLWLGLIRDPEHLAVQILFVVLGTVAIAAGIALVVHAGLTGGSMELLMRAAEARGRDPFKTRRLLEIAIVGVGVILGGDIGLATVFFVLAMSPTLRLAQQALEDHRRGRENRLRPIWD